MGNKATVVFDDLENLTQDSLVVDFHWNGNLINVRNILDSTDWIGIETPEAFAKEFAVAAWEYFDTTSFDDSESNKSNRIYRLVSFKDAESMNTDNGIYIVDIETCTIKDHVFIYGYNRNEGRIVYYPENSSRANTLKSNSVYRNAGIIKMREEVE